MSDLYKRESLISEAQTPYISAAIAAVNSGHDAMYSFLMRMLPQEYKNILIGFCNMGLHRKMNLVQWSNSLNSSFAPPNKSNPSDDTITLVIGDDSFQACPSKPLRAVFNEYADKKSVSLKTLRFSHAGKTLFLSTVGKKSPDELGIIDNDSIEVYSTEVVAPSRKDIHKSQEANKSITKKQKKAYGKCNKRKKKLYRLKVEKSDKEYKEEHSLMLTKLHEEAAFKFKEIRQQLNALSLFKQQPKIKVQTKMLDQSCSYPKFNSISEGLGGKAGRTHFIVNVGEVNNLYKSSKSILHASSTSSIIDLHGCSRTEAISKLNAGLKNWTEQAMAGSYPFIHSVSIVCGGGSQVLSEVVEKWIIEKPNVCNAPKMKMARCKFPPVAYEHNLDTFNINQLY